MELLYILFVITVIAWVLSVVLLPILHKNGKLLYIDTVETMLLLNIGIQVLILLIQIL